MTGESLVVIEAPGPEEIFLRTDAVSTASTTLDSTDACDSTLTRLRADEYRLAAAPGG